MRESSKRLSIFEFFKYLVLALMPILNIYDGILIINFGFLILMVIAVIEIRNNRGAFSYNREFLLIMSVLVGLNIVTGFLHLDMLDIDSVMNNTFSLMIVVLIGTYYLKPSVVDKERFFKFLAVIGVICTLFLFVQAILYANGVVLYGYIPGLKVNEDVVKDTLSVSISYGRPTSFFTEPAHYAIFMLPVYALSIDRRKFFLSILFLAGLIVSTSSTGIMGAIIITAVFIIKEPKIPLIFKWILTLIGIVLFIQLLPEINESGVFEKVKFVNLKSNIRVFGTLKYFKYFGVKEALFGVGLNRMAHYLSKLTSEYIYNYANAIFFAFFSFGLIGGSLWTAYVVRLHRLRKSKVLYIVFLVVYLTDQILFNRNLVFLLLILYIYSDMTTEEIPASIVQQKMTLTESNMEEPGENAE